MHVIADTKSLVSDGLIDQAAARVIELRGREAMVSLAINAILGLGILCATFGLIFWLADAAAVTLCGLVLLGAGLTVLAKAGAAFRILGNAGALIGAGMLIAGAGIELTSQYPDIAAWVMIPGGLVISAIATFTFLRGGLTTRFVQGAIALMGFALHLAGIAHLILEAGSSGVVWPLFHLYSAAALVVFGWLLDVRLVTALAIAPFAQALDTGTSYFHAAYVFYSPESTLSILQMSVAVVLGLWIAHRSSERIARHSRIFATMAFIVANLCALVGSLWGDWVGQTVWGPGRYWSVRDQFDGIADWQAASNAFKETALFISADTYAIVWGIVLAAIIARAAWRANRGLFNAAITFGAIHGYTQMFESFFDAPGAYVLAGFSAVALAWIVWTINRSWGNEGRLAA
ncbi:MAG: hypothetical protein AAF748_01840 [Pseudomonadota bacterium]